MDTELFRITISFSSKWVVGYMKAISCGYMESSGIWGYHQRFEDQARRSEYLDPGSPHKKKKLKPEVAYEILKEIDKIDISLAGPENSIAFSPIFYTLSVTRNKTTISVSWNGSSNEYYEPINRLWHKIDHAVSFSDEPKSSSYAELMDLERFRFPRVNDEE